jgi:hypothetical protein
VRVWGKRGYFIPNSNGICMGKRIIPTEGFSRARNKGTMMFMHGVCGYNIWAGQSNKNPSWKRTGRHHIDPIENSMYV